MVAVSRLARLAARPVAAAQQALHPGQEHGQVEGLGQVVVGPRLQALHHVLGQAPAVSISMGVKFPASRMRRATANPSMPGSMTSRITRSKAGRRWPAARRASACGPVARHLDLVALELEVELDPDREVLLVLDHQYASHGQAVGGAALEQAGEGDGEGGAPVGARAVRDDGSPVALHHRAHDEEAEAGAGAGLRRTSEPMR